MRKSASFPGSPWSGQRSFGRSPEGVKTSLIDLPFCVLQQSFAFGETMLPVYARLASRPRVLMNAGAVPKNMAQGPWVGDLNYEV